MNFIDIILIIPLLWGLYIGFRKGLIIELASLIALVLGVHFGFKFSDIAAVYLQKWFLINAQYLPLISFAVVFILVVIVVFLIAKLVEKIVKATSLGFVNKVIGAAFGTAKFAMILSMILFFINKLDENYNFIKKDLKEESLLYKPISSIMPFILPKLKESGVYESLKKEKADWVEKDTNNTMQ